MVSSRKGAPLALPGLSKTKLAETIRSRVPELASIARCEIDILLNRDSAHVGPTEWRDMAARIRARQSQFDGVVLLHGTDTLAYTASALSFLLRPCKKPVVITGAQRPLSAIRTDARRNLISAVEIAADGPRDIVGQVTVFFDDQLYQGNRVRKRSASEFAAFSSPKAPSLARVGTEIIYDETQRISKRSSSPILEPTFCREVALFQVTPGFPSGIIARKLLPELKALVLTIFPSGTAPTHEPEFLLLLRTARAAGKPVVLVTEGTRPLPHQGYAAGAALRAPGIFWADGMTPECAFVKTCLLLGQGDSRHFATIWRQNLAGEG